MTHTLRLAWRGVAKQTLEEAADETGWKLVHGDVFRPPTGTFGPIMLAVFVGSGVQIVMMALCVMLFAILGFLSPANRGGLMTALLLLYVFNGSFAGYVSARLYKSFHGKARTRTTLLTAVMYPVSVAPHVRPLMHAQSLAHTRRAPAPVCHLCGRLCGQLVRVGTRL